MANPAGDQILIEARGLSRDYGEFRAVHPLDFAIGGSEVVGFLGPNGAGKSTTMRMLTTFLPPTDGTAFVGGHDILGEAGLVRRLIGYLPETPPLYEEMRVAAYLRFVAELKGVPRRGVAARVDWALESCGLRDRARQVIGTLSKGYRQRVGIAQAVIHDPRVLILDEPTSGLDPNQILEIRELIRELARERTILLSTHILQEVASVCTRVMILHQGRIVHDAPLDDRRSRIYDVEIWGEAPGPLPAVHPGVTRSDVRVRGARSSIELELQEDADPAEILSALLDAGWRVRQFAPRAGELERVFAERTASDQPRTPEEEAA